jgi:flagellar M-ring protein FliF
MNALVQMAKNLGAVRLAALGGVGLVMLGFFIFLMTRLSQPDLTLLYGDLDPSEAGQIAGRLEQQQIPYRIAGGGTQILAPSDRTAALRIQLAEAGLPSGGTIGYEIFDKTQSLGTSNFVQSINQVRALEGELSRTITSIQGVRNARVHLVLPKREVFSRERQEPSASIVLRMRGAGRLDRPQVQAVQHLVAAAVPDLKPSRISIVDDRGNLLARGGDTNSQQQASANAEEMRIAYENRVARAVETLLERSVGVGKVRAEVSADLNFERVVENSEIFDPATQVVRSTQTVEDNASTNENQGSTGVTVQTNLPEAQGLTAGGSTASGSKNARTEETVNYEISKTVRNTVREAGALRRITIAVLIDGNYTGADRAYQPRGAEELQKLEALVKSTVGFNGERGDSVELVNLPFAQMEDIQDSAATLFGLSKREFLQLAEIIVLAVVGLLVILLVVRPVLTRLFEALPSASTALGAAGAAGAPAGVAALAGPLDPSAAALAPPDEEPEDLLDAMIDINRVEGRVRASSLKKIGEIVDKHPEEAVAIVRNWMYQEAP